MFAGEVETHGKRFVLTLAIVGSLVIACDVARASVLVDGQQVTETYQHRGMINGLALGRHAIELRAPGFHPTPTRSSSTARPSSM